MTFCPIAEKFNTLGVSFQLGHVQRVSSFRLCVCCLFFKKTPRFSLETVASSTTRARAPRLKRRLEQRCTVRLLLTDPARPLRARIHPSSLSGCGSTEGEAAAARTFGHGSGLAGVDGEFL